MKLLWIQLAMEIFICTLQNQIHNVEEKQQAIHHHRPHAEVGCECLLSLKSQSVNVALYDYWLNPAQGGNEGQMNGTSPAGPDCTRRGHQIPSCKVV